MRVKLKDVRKVEVDHPGILNDFLRVGAICGTEIEISREHFDELNAHRFKGAKLGTVLHEMLKPVVGRAIRF